MSGDDGPIPKKLEKKRTMFLYLIQSLIDMTRIFLQKRANLELKTRKKLESKNDFCMLRAFLLLEKAFLLN